jgi:nucleoside-diphosphate-sugar epimerase
MLGNLEKMKHLPEEDLIHIYNHTAVLWEEMRNKVIFISGGTGFFGIWLLESFLYANKKAGLNAEMVVLTRSIDKFYTRYPHLHKEKGYSLIEGDITNFEYLQRDINFIIHAASGGSAVLDDLNNGSLVNISIDGTRHLFDFASKCPGVKVLYTSSGAVYGKQPYNLTHIGEDYLGAPDVMNISSVYGESKRYCELLSGLYHRQYHFEVKIARCFAFVGPYLPLQSNYAIGNFIYDILNNRHIVIQSDGTPRRSYLYSSDLMIWLWTILFKGQNLHPYNVGSDIDLSIYELATLIKKLTNSSLEIKVEKPVESKRAERYVPSVNRAKTELGLEQIVSLNEAVMKTIHWNKF